MVLTLSDEFAFIAAADRLIAREKRNREEIEMLRKALEPFARIATLVDSAPQQHERWRRSDNYAYATGLLMKDFRAARAALEQARQAAG